MGGMNSLVIVAVLIIILVWLDYRERSRPLGGTEHFGRPSYTAGASLRDRSEATAIQTKYSFDPRSLKDPRFFRG